MDDQESELFNYTTGRFLANEAFRLRERRRVFDIPGLFGIVAKALHCETDEIVGFRKLGEGGLNRSFLITLYNGFQLVARIPYPLMIPKAYALASEVATMDFLRSQGLPIPEVYAYSFTSENEAETEYILMQYLEGTDLSQKWFELEEDQIVSLMDQLAKIESTMIDLEVLSGNEGIPLDKQIDDISLEKDRFCIGPDVSRCPCGMDEGNNWTYSEDHVRRTSHILLPLFDQSLTIDENAKSVLVSGAKKELAYLDKFGSPRAPYNRFRREYYGYEKQPPSGHAKNLRRYLHLAPSLVPDEEALSAFCIRHPDLTDSNLKVSTDSSGLRIVSMLDWQHDAVLPLFLHAGMPGVIQNEGDEVSQRMIKPRLRDDFNGLSDEEKEWEMELLRRRRVHYHYNLSTAVHNRIHHRGMVYPLNTFRRRIFNYVTAPWEGETINLLYELIDMVSDWASFAKDGALCPVVFTEEEKAAAEKLYQALANSEMGERMLRDNFSCGEDFWVPAALYEDAKAFTQELKQRTLEALAEDEETTKEVYAAVEAQWPLDDVDEQELEEYK